MFAQLGWRGPLVALNLCSGKRRHSMTGGEWWVTISEDSFDALADAIRATCSPLVLDESSLAALGKAARSRTVQKGEHLCRQGDTSTSLFFVRSGLLRYYYLADGTEHTGQFFEAGMFVADVFALTNAAPALQNIDALADSELLIIPRAALYTAYDADHAIERFGRILMEEAMAGSQRRTASFLQLTPQQRYDRFVQLRPKIAARVPLYIVASFLGITPEALSRIRRRRVA
jgi:CRP-like cAMP-binding protein